MKKCSILGWGLIQGAAFSRGGGGAIRGFTVCLATATET